MRQELKERLDLEITDAVRLLEDLQSKSFTGYIKVITWDAEEFIPLLEGKALKVIKVSDEGVLDLAYPSYNFPDKGVVEIYETDILAIINALRKQEPPKVEGPLCIAGYGEEFQKPTPSAHLDVEKFGEVARNSYMNGYVYVHTDREPIGMIVFYNGEPVGAFSAGRSGERALSYIKTKWHDSMVSILLLEADLVPLLISILHVREAKKGKVEDLPKLMDELQHKKMSTLIYVEESPVEKNYIFLYKGYEVLSLKRDLFNIHPTTIDSIPKNADYVMYPLYVNLHPKVMELHLSTSVGEENLVPTTRVADIKEAFIEEIGPIGKAVWKKIFNELGWEEGMVPLSKFDEFVERLAQEIPYDNHRSAFVKRVRRLAE